MEKWGLTSGGFGEPEQTADHIIDSCSLHRAPFNAGLFEFGQHTRAWIQNT